MNDRTTKIALITEIFSGPDAGARLAARLGEAASEGAALVLLPELPVDPWAPATREVRDADAEPPDGPRHRMQADAAREAGVTVVGGAIVVEPDSGKRHNTALVFDRAGDLVGSYRKCHLPQEEGFWEASHYEPGDAVPAVVDVAGVRLGLQICSDANRPVLFQVLGALGAELIVAPRATPTTSYERWKLVLRANAVTTASYVISVNRPPDPDEASIGGPSIAIAPDGEPVVESTDRLALVTLDRDRLEHARRDYPGYLDVRTDLYVRAWESVRRDRAKRKP